MISGVRPCQTMMLQVRCKHKFKTKNPRPRVMDRRVFEAVTQPLYPANDHYLRFSCLDPTANQQEEEVIHMSCVVRKWAFGHMQTAKLQASLRIRAVSPEALLFAFRSSRP